MPCGNLEGSGNIKYPYPVGLLEEWNKYAQQITKKYHIPFVNISDVFSYVPKYKETPSYYTYDNIHFGSLARDQDLSVSGTISMLITQKLLKIICDHDGWKLISQKDWDRSS